MAWWIYLVAVFAGPFLVNGIPHFVNGISGRRFPSPFSGGPGTEDSPVRNVLWGAFNFLVGAFLLYLIRDSLGDPVILAELVVIGLGMAVLLAMAFGDPARFGMRRK